MAKELNKMKIKNSFVLAVALCSVTPITNSAFAGSIYNTWYGTGALNGNADPPVTGIYDTAIGYDALPNVTSGTDNTGVGFEALYSNTTGGGNDAFGAFALYYNTSGDNNIAVGGGALEFNTTGFKNTACGMNSLEENTTGAGNTGLGSGAMFFNTTNSYNTAVGFNALWNSDGNDNTAIGATALFSDTAGSNNDASGFEALYENTTGSYEVASGYEALYSDTNGGNNTAMGAFALYNASAGDNIALGYEAGYNVASGTNNIQIGNEGDSTDANVIRIGSVQTNTFIAGIHGTTVASGVAVYVNSSGQLGVLSSSARFKQNIQSMGDSSDVILSLHPVKFQYKKDMDPKGTPQFGLVAEEVNQIDPDLVVRDGKNQIYTVRYEAVNAMLLNEFLKQHRTVQEQKTEITTLEKRLNELEEAVRSLNKTE
jgi:trimeric autotransporter adhesin